MSTKTSESYEFGDNELCMEPIFVPKPNTEINLSQAKEAGWLLAQVYNANTKTGYLAILDTQNISKGPTAIIKNKHHLPLSFHGTWVDELKLTKVNKG